METALGFWPPSTLSYLIFVISCAGDWPGFARSPRWMDRQISNGEVYNYLCTMTEPTFIIAEWMSWWRTVCCLTEWGPPLNQFSFFCKYVMYRETHSFFFPKIGLSKFMNTLIGAFFFGFGSRRKVFWFSQLQLRNVRFCALSLLVVLVYCGVRSL